MFSDGANGIENGIDILAVLFEHLHSPGRQLQIIAQFKDAARGFADVLLPVVHLTVTGVRAGSSMTAGAGHFVSGCDHLVEGGAH
ncbi:hypothetical protein D3C85_1645750 [compost metagenome]